MTRANRLLLAAVVGGFGIGLLLRFGGDARAIAAAAALAPVGALWLAALKMTLVPLVFSLVASAVNTLLASRAGGRTIATTLAVFAGLLVFVTVAGLAATMLLLRLWPVPPNALAGLIGGGAAARAMPPGLVEQLIALVPENPVGAAAQGQIAPLVVFALCFGWAIPRLTPEQGASLAAVLSAVAAAMMAIVNAVLAAAPVGVFVLSLEAAVSAGAGLAAVLAQGVLFEVVMMCGAIAVCYAIANCGGGVQPRRFARAAFGAQAVAAGTCSSMAALPSLLTSAEQGLGFESALARATLPLAVSTFRFGTALSVVVSSLFAASAAGVHLGAGEYLVATLLIIMTNSGVVGLPGAAVIYAAEAPIFQAIGAPLAFIPLWIAVFAIPDIFVTVTNVTADLAAATVIRRLLSMRLPRLSSRPRSGETAVAVGSGHAVIEGAE